MGGTLASELTRRVPERVKRLAVRDVTAKRATANKKAVRIEMIAHAECGRQDHRLPLLWSSVVAPARLQDKELQAFVRRMAMNMAPRPSSVTSAPCWIASLHARVWPRTVFRCWSRSAARTT
jgi:hypothetical protein